MIGEIEDAVFRSGFVALVGRPSAGKSTLLNALCGQKVAIISPKPQTTRNVIRGIVNRATSQLVFLDTPGFTEAEDFLAGQLREELRSAVRKAEAVLYLLDLSRPPQPHLEMRTQNQPESGYGPAEMWDEESPTEERGLLALLRDAMAIEPRPLCLALNKADLLPDISQRQQRIAEYLNLVRQYFPDLQLDHCFELSAKKRDGLEPALQFLSLQLPAGKALYDSDIYTDQEPQFRIQELIREQALAFCGRELPYALYVEVADLEYRPLSEIEGASSQLQGLAAQGRKDRIGKIDEIPKVDQAKIQNQARWELAGEDFAIAGLETVTEQNIYDNSANCSEGEPSENIGEGLWIRAFLQVERESQKGILVGKGGSRIREIRKRSSRAVRQEFGCPIQLDLQVKVDYKWRRKRR